MSIRSRVTKRSRSRLPARVFAPIKPRCNAVCVCACTRVSRICNALLFSLARSLCPSLHTTPLLPHAPASHLPLTERWTGARARTHSSIFDFLSSAPSRRHRRTSTRISRASLLSPTGVLVCVRCCELCRFQANSLVITCDDGSQLDVLQIQPPGKKPMDAKSFW